MRNKVVFTAVALLLAVFVALGATPAQALDETRAALVSTEAGTAEPTIELVIVPQPVVAAVLTDFELVLIDSKMDSTAMGAALHERESLADSYSFARAKRYRPPPRAVRA